MDYTNLKPHQEIDENGFVFELNSLSAYFQQVTDPSQEQEWPFGGLLDTTG